MFFCNRREDPDTCGASFDLDNFTSCYDNSTELLEYLQDLCDGERECDVTQEGVATVIDSCAGQEPYLRFGYNCVRKCKERQHFKFQKRKKLFKLSLN